MDVVKTPTEFWAEAVGLGATDELGFSSEYQRGRYRIPMSCRALIVLISLSILFSSLRQFTLPNWVRTMEFVML